MITMLYVLGYFSLVLGLIGLAFVIPAFFLTIEHVPVVSTKALYWLMAVVVALFASSYLAVGSAERMLDDVFDKLLKHSPEEQMERIFRTEHSGLRHRLRGKWLSHHEGVGQ